jgi:hypothetical protein
MTTYSFDDKADSFMQTTYSPLTQPGPQILNAGTFSVAQRGLRSMVISTTYTYDNLLSPSAYVPAPVNAPGSFAVELAGQTGGFAQLQANGQGQIVSQPVEPLVAAATCPSFASPQTFLFVTIPAAVIPAGALPVASGWDPTSETAYGTVALSSKGSTVTLQSIAQFTLPSAGGSGSPAQPASSSLTGTCGSTYFGNTIAVPGQVVLTNPGVGNALSPQAIIGIGPSGLLVEDNGSGSSGTLAGSSPPLPYNNVLGAGTGAVGLPMASAALDTGALAGAQYLGFIYSAGVYTSGISNVWTSHVASFGFSSVPSACASVAASTSTLIYGGDFPGDNPSASSSGFGNCDFAIDFGNQDSANNGLYPHATVWVGSGYAANFTKATYSFPAVAIAGQLNGKFAIFLIGEDSSQPWAVYLLQSN